MSATQAQGLVGVGIQHMHLMMLRAFEANAKPAVNMLRGKEAFDGTTVLSAVAAAGMVGDANLSGNNAFLVSELRKEASRMEWPGMVLNSLANDEDDEKRWLRFQNQIELAAMALFLDAETLVSIVEYLDVEAKLIADSDWDELKHWAELLQVWLPREKSGILNRFLNTCTGGA